MASWVVSVDDTSVLLNSLSDYSIDITFDDDSNNKSITEDFSNNAIIGDVILFMLKNDDLNYDNIKGVAVYLSHRIIESGIQIHYMEYNFKNNYIGTNSLYNNIMKKKQPSYSITNTMISLTDTIIKMVGYLTVTLITASMFMTYSLNSNTIPPT